MGSGPAGLACATDLARLGHEVTVFEALHELGGVLVYGIPEFRLPKEIVRNGDRSARGAGRRVRDQRVIGMIDTIDELLEEEGFDAVFLGVGAGLPRFLKIPGENLIGVYSANEFLTRVNLMKAYLPDADTPVLDFSGQEGGRVRRRQHRHGRGPDRLRLGAGRRRSSTAGRKRRCRPAAKRSTTPGRKASSSTSWPRRSSSPATTTASCKRCACSGWNWANPMRAAGAGRFPFEGSE